MTLLRAVQRSIHLSDGPLFLTAMKAVNEALQSLKYPPPSSDPLTAPSGNKLMPTVETWMQKGLPKEVLMRIIEENYQRAVGPNVRSLKRYEAFSSTVYGELMPSLAQEMINITKLKEDSLFIDLGSGVGNVVVQASLQTGCRSYGIELMPHPSRVATDMVEQMKIRCRMWGVVVGDMEVEQGDMLKSKRVDELISRADVVLVDNKVFEESCTLICRALDFGKSSLNYDSKRSATSQIFGPQGRCYCHLVVSLRQLH
jgi:H3 lysine-79-specific histone-lysine N-methyltransferase